jgi:transcriptional regulator with XRE-family HTH domain
MKTDERIQFWRQGVDVRNAERRPERLHPRAVRLYFGALIAHARKTQGISQTSLGRLSGCSRSMVSLVERGEINVSLVLSLAMLYNLGLNVAMLDPGCIVSGLADPSIPHQLVMNPVRSHLLRHREPRTVAQVIAGLPSKGGIRR